MRRREFITLLGGATAAGPVVARAQTRTLPTVGFLYAGSAMTLTPIVARYREGLAKAGFVEGQNVSVEYLFADGKYDRLSELSAELVRRQVSVIVVPNSTPAALAAQRATSTIPIVFSLGVDPTKLGLVKTLGHPGGNATGVNFFVTELGSKLLGLLRDLNPGTSRVGLLINPDNETAAPFAEEVKAAARLLALQIDVVGARNAQDIDHAFSTLSRVKADGLIVFPDQMFFSRREQITKLASQQRLIATYSVRDFAEAGGLMSYGTDQIEVSRLVGEYIARILKSERPANLPVAQSTKFELVINLKTAKTLGLTIPPMLLARADEVIE